MRVWIVTSGEPLPIDPGGQRLLRHGIAAGLMAERGWDVTWWTARFDHTLKRMREGSATAPLDTRGRIVLLPSPGYARNISLARIRDHGRLASAFTQQARTAPRPDAILCSFPPIELARAATGFGREAGVPVLADVRDLWPDIFAPALPRALRPFAPLLLAPYQRMARRALRDANAITGITEPIVQWACAKAGRAPGPLDRSFPLACDPPAADDDLGVAAAVERWAARGVTPSRFVVCFFGALGEQFDFDTVLRAASALEASLPSALFVLAGAGSALERLQAEAARRPNLVVPGWLGRDDLQGLMRVAALGLAPYRNEYSFTLSVPNKVIEYLSAGLPVLSCLRGETASLLRSAGCGASYEESDADSLQRAVTALANDAARRDALGRNARGVYGERFTAQRVYRDMLDHLERVARAAAP